MALMRFETKISHPAAQIFELIADLPNYSKWLPPSGTFAAVTPASAEPTHLGTTYSDGKDNLMKGEVTAFDPPHRLTFRQTPQLKLAGLKGNLAIQIQYSLTLQPGQGQTQVVREVSLETAGIFRLLQPLVARTVRRESQRILARMKTYLETTP